jgi:hypothetical protein
LQYVLPGACLSQQQQQQEEQEGQHFVSDAQGLRFARRGALCSLPLTAHSSNSSSWCEEVWVPALQVREIR